MTAATRGQAAYEAFRSAVPDWVCNVPAGPWDELSPAIRAGFDAIAAQEPHAAPGGRSFEDMLADPREQFDLRSELLASISEYAAAPPASAGIKPWHPHGVPQPAPELTAAMDAIEKVVANHERVMYAAAIDIRHGQPSAARRLLGEELGGWNGPEWDGTETGAQYLDRTREDS